MKKTLSDNSNIAHWMFDKVYIPSHYDRYEPRDMLQDEEDFECPQLIKEQRTRKSGRSEKRYVVKWRKTAVFPQTQSENYIKWVNVTDLNLIP